MDKTSIQSRLTAARLVGDIDHPEFRDAVAIVRTTARTDPAVNGLPEVVLVFQPRPDHFPHREIEVLQSRWPLVGIVAVVGSWCEGETRTGRPWPGVRRLYWYEFPAWWQQQIALRTAGRCPEWARPSMETNRAPSIRKPDGFNSLRGEIKTRQRGLIRLGTANRDTADSLADVLHHAGYATVWNPAGLSKSVVRGAVAGIWDGGQLDDREVPALTAFCHALDSDAAPVVALLDFPRADRCEVAKQLGVATVLGKPWINADLVATIDGIVSRNATAPKSSGRAA